MSAIASALVAVGAIPTAGTATVTVVATSNGLLVNETALIVTPDMLAGKGVAHAIDSVLTPAT